MGTVKTDNPSLTVRHIKGPNPYRIVLSRSLSFPRKCHLLDDNADFKTIIATDPAGVERFSRTKRGKGLIYWSVANDRNGHLDITDLIDQARKFGLQSLLIEGGSQIATSFLRAGLVDKYVAVVAPMVLGAGIDSIGDLGAKKIENAIVFDRAELIRSGRDIIVVGYPKGRN